MQRTIASLTIFGALIAISGLLDAAEHTKDTLDKVKAGIKAKKAIIIDVREQSEWDEGHLKAAKLVPLSKIKKGIDKKTLPKDLIIYCH